ncbi:uncharacterized protein MONBRDRAFT_14000 [Monosiga brevicollis MX1]|uniref:RNA exonuclease 4 n=1 Tax=Monosiga brevicollis TaxID=81824 RepID=A9UPK9_MONBE|nr:uncharacterized protein MONBRDRAFT_14000 [Monosiga brevicollis MX1]EDQ92888.1 predicted protein [Monosiga brevicollis MX1]|eukprot:XP_001742650.1 hypothetical protein [Monosiga brevicollis MX1]
MQVNRADKYVAIDCEMVGGEGSKDLLARVSLVNRDGDVLLDTFVRPKERVLDYRTEVSGVRKQDLLRAPSFEEAQAKVARLLENKVLVGHDLKHDMKVLLLSHPKRHTRDTSQYEPFHKVAKTKRPGLRKLVHLVLGTRIQTGEHSSVEDARATMALYRHAAKDWEKELKSKRYGTTDKKIA